MSIKETDNGYVYLCCDYCGEIGGDLRKKWSAVYNSIKKLGWQARGENKNRHICIDCLCLESKKERSEYAYGNR